MKHSPIVWALAILFVLSFVRCEIKHIDDGKNDIIIRIGFGDDPKDGGE